MRRLRRLNQDKQTLLTTRGTAKRAQNTLESRICTSCKSNKPLDQFYTYKKPNDQRGTRSVCIECFGVNQRKVYHNRQAYYRFMARERIKKDPEKSAKSKAKFLEKNPGYMKEYNRKYRERKKREKMENANIFI